MAAFATLVCQSGEAEFSDCLPVSALVCVFAFDTGGLGLWLGAFGKSGLFMCQSTPGPPMPCFAAQSFVLAAFATLVCQRNCVFLCKGTKLKNSAKPNSGDSLPVFALECFSANETGVLISEFSAS